MHLRSIFLSTFLFAAAALAHPLEHDSFARIKRANDSTYGAGAALLGPHNTYKAVSSFMVLPQISGDAGSGVMFWNGIGQDCDGDASVRTGVSCHVNDDGTTSCQPFYQWSPDVIVYQDLDVAAGDKIGLDVIVTSANTALTYTTNSRGGLRVEHLTSNWSLCLNDAIWAVSALGDANPHPLLANFGNITFDWATATSVNGQNYAPGDKIPATSNIVQDGKTVTNTQVKGSDIIVSYVQT